MRKWECLYTVRSINLIADYSPALPFVLCTLTSHELPILCWITVSIVDILVLLLILEKMLSSLHGSRMMLAVVASCLHAKLFQLCLTLWDPLWSVDCQVILSMGFSRQKYWSGLPCPPPRGHHNPGIEPVSLMSSSLAGGFFTTSTTWKAQDCPI